MTLPGAIVGLPPAAPPAARALFVYRTPSLRLAPPVMGLLVAFRGDAKRGAYDAVTFIFFKSARSARRFLAMPLQGGVLSRNVLVSWDHRLAGATGWRKAVRACLRVATSAGVSPTPKRSIPRASLATFAGYWGGHTRGLRITTAGLGHEFEDSGCCVRLYEMNFQILSVKGTLTRATATYRVVWFKHYRGGPTLHRGQLGKLLLRDGIATNSLTGDYFCSFRAWGATAACGA